MRKLTRLAIIGGASALALALSAPAFAAFTPRLDVSVPNRLGASGQGEGTPRRRADGRGDGAGSWPTRRSISLRTRVSPGQPSAAGHPGAGRRPRRRDRARTGTIEVRAVNGHSARERCPGSAHAARTGLHRDGDPHGVLGHQGLRRRQHGRAAGVLRPHDGRGAGTGKLEGDVLRGQPNDVPPGTPGRAPFGIKLVDTVLTFNRGVYTNPTTAGPYLWTSIWTPYNPGVGTA